MTQTSLFDPPRQRHSETSTAAAESIAPDTNRLRLNLIGQRFGMLVVTKMERLSNGGIGWICVCDCGGSNHLDSYRLRSGKTKSCGCQQLKGIEKLYGHRKTHGCKGTRAYKTWSSMKERCLNTSHKSYRHYGGAGITICERWVNSFASFIADMGHPPEGYSIDRINVSKGYSPDNCRWASNEQQQRNKNNNRLLTAFGETKCAAEWLEDQRCKANWTALYKRIELGWDHERAISQPMKAMKNRKLGPGSGQPSRRVELVQRGLVVDSGETRLNDSGRSAVVWRAKD